MNDTENTTYEHIKYTLGTPKISIVICNLSYTWYKINAEHKIEHAFNNGTTIHEFVRTNHSDLHKFCKNGDITSTDITDIQNKIAVFLKKQTIERYENLSTIHIDHTHRPP